MGLIGLSFFVLMTLFHLWDLPGDVLAAPESASGLDRCNLSLSLSLSGRQGWRTLFGRAPFGKEAFRYNMWQHMD